jgi:outer membrane protein assembly factor BamB
LPVEFGEAKHLAWKIAIHDKGWSSPVVHGEQVWLTTAKEDGTELYAVAVGLNTGAFQHDIKLFTPKNTPDLRKYNSFASPTPCLEDGKGYFHYGTYGTACLELKTGKVLWQRTDINVDHWRGPASSPVLHGDQLYLTFDGHDAQFFVALNKLTGETVWQRDRAIQYKTSDGDFKKAFSTPHVIEVDGKAQVISSAAEATIAYDPADGKELWTVYHGGMNEACRPVYAEGLVLLTAGHTKTLLAVRPGQGVLGKESIAWEYKKDAPTRPSPVVHDGHVYCSSDEGIAVCLKLKTGELVWKESLGGPCSASPILAEGNLYYCCENGKIEVIKASPEFQRVATNTLDDGGKASPAAVADLLIHRSYTHLYAFRKKP